VVQKHLDAAKPAILISDGGEFGQWAQACLSGPRRLINGPSGAIGGSLCYGIAAKKAEPDATVIAMMGDGTAGFHFSEFETAAREGAPFVAVIGNDACWNAEHQIQRNAYGPERAVGCELLPTRYDAVATALGGYGELVQESAALRPALERALASRKPACVNVAIERLPAPNIARKTMVSKASPH
jgi:acetolactate synthase-1/2/3 large subunit